MLQMKKQIDLLLPAKTSMNFSHVSLPAVLSCIWCVAKETFVAWFDLTTDGFQMSFHSLFICEYLIAFRTSKPLRILRMLLPYVTQFVTWMRKRKRAVWTLITILCCTTLLLMIKEIVFAKFFSTGWARSWIRDFWHVANLLFDPIPTPWYTQSMFPGAMTSTSKSERDSPLGSYMFRHVFS